MTNNSGKDLLGDGVKLHVNSQQAHTKSDPYSSTHLEGTKMRT